MNREADDLREAVEDAELELEELNECGDLEDRLAAVQRLAQLRRCLEARSHKDFPS